MTFTRIALKKLNELLLRKNFIEVLYIDEKNITIRFEDRVCNITPFGNVTWANDE